MVSASAGYSASGVFCNGQRASRLLRIPISQYINTPRSGMWPASGLTLAQQGDGRTAQGALRPKGDAYDRSSRDMGNLGMDLEACAEMANKLADELEQRVADVVSVFPAGTKRILLTGTPLAIPNWKLHHIIETSGAAVVCEEMCTGTRYFEHLFDESATTPEGQLQALSERYMKTDALALYTALKGAGVGARVSPTPRQARSECGSALLVDCDDRTRIESLAAAQGLAFQRIVELERQIDASRDRFC